MSEETILPEEPAPSILEPEKMTSRFRIHENGPAQTILMWVLPLTALATVAVVLGLVRTGYLQVVPGADTTAGKKLALQNKASENAQFGQQADSALHRVSWTEALSKLQTSRECCEELAETLPQLNSQLTSLQANEKGRRIASSVEWTDRFLAIRDRPRLAEAELPIQRESIQALIEQCERALDDSDIVIPCTDAFVSKAATTFDRLSKARQEVQEDHRLIAALVLISAQASPADLDLSEATQQRERELEKSELDKLAETKEAQRKAAENERLRKALEAQRKIEAARAEQERIEQAARIAAAAAEKEKKRQEAELAAQRAAAEQAHRDKVAAFEREFPNMKSLLMPFISHGNLQLRGGSWMGGEEGPVSLEAIHQSGALNTNGTSHMLMYFGNGVNGRPQGSFPRGHAYDNGQVYKVQTFLLKYGDIMVEKNLLRP